MSFNKPSGRVRAARHAVALGLLALSATVAAAPNDAERIADLEKKLELLSKRLMELESGGSRAAAAITPEAKQAIAKQSERIEQIEKSIAHISETTVSKRDAGLPLHGFYDVGYARSSNDPNGRHGGFSLGNFDLYMTPEMGRFKGLIELAFEYGEGGSFAIDLERLQVGYTFNDALTAWAGRFHTPYGYWNTAFHHGAQLQTSILRPRMIAFEDQGGVLPSHTVGLLATGNVRLGDGRFQYDAFVGNGSRMVDGILDYNAVKDDNKNKAFGANVRYSFGGSLDGLTVGAHMLNEEVGAYTGDTLANRTKLNMAGAWAVLERDQWEVIGEYYSFRNKDLSGGTGSHTSWAGFGQVGYLVGDGWMPYARYEKASLNQSDNYFASMNSGRSYTRPVVGLRYALTPTSAVKVEFNRTREDRPEGQITSSEARAQFAVRF